MSRYGADLTFLRPFFTFRHYIQLDDWWYVGGPQNRSIKGLVTCTASFTPRVANLSTGTGPSLFPQGLSPLTKQFGGNLMLYMVNFCPTNPYLPRKDAAESFKDPTTGGYFLGPANFEASELAYGALMDAGLAQGMTMFEVDFMSRNFMMVPHYRTTAAAAEGWQTGMSRAAERRGLAMQWCSDDPQDVIASVLTPAVTQFRGSPDFACGLGGEPMTGNWDVGGQVNYGLTVDRVSLNVNGVSDCRLTENRLRCSTADLPSRC